MAMRFGFFFWPYAPEYTVSLAADPVRTVELFGRHVLPHVAH